ncbi:hypothetical protein [Microbacterium sp. bgisy203]|uniref:hypothetical protein n=1 Tax=Microbacterium sp. bgisy203 TaxID=3413799 RepID=UPI003D72B529
MLVLDPAIAIAGAVMFASAAAGPLWRRRVRLIGISTLAMLALYTGDADAWYRLVAALIGLAAGSLLLRRGRVHAWHRSSIAETRSLVAVLVAVAAVGPFSALLSDGGHGILSRVSDMFTQVDQRLAEACARDSFPACDHVTAAVVTHGAGPALLALLPLALLAVAAWGLRAGRRAAWVLALIVGAALIAQAIVGILLGEGAGEYAGDALDVTATILADLVVPIVMMIVLLRTRRAFDIVADGRVARRAAVIAVVAVVAAMIAYIASAMVFRADFVSTST